MNTNKIYDEGWMVYALMLAKEASKIGEVSVGAVLVLNNKIVGKGYNCTINTQDPTAHAEIIALRNGGRILNNYRLLHTTLYVTLEPCVMCIGAIIHARVSRLVFGAEDKKIGAVTSIIDVLNLSKRSCYISVTSGILRGLCSRQLISFFKKRRH